MEIRGYQKVDLSIHLPGHEGFGHTPNPFNGNNSIRPKDKSTLARGNIPFRGDMQKPPLSAPFRASSEVTSGVGFGERSAREDLPAELIAELEVGFTPLERVQEYGFDVVLDRSGVVWPDEV